MACASSSCAPASSTTSFSPRPKAAKDAAVFQRGPVKGAVNYPPYECNENDGVLTKPERDELLMQHKRFKIYPSGGDEGLIHDYVRSVPYSSNKKTFSGRTGREGFELFQYVFQKPDEPGKEYVVMWDYQNGLVRITPFFKSLNYPKTAPNKVLGYNNGLRELSHSITGGSIAAQGYWMPYGCARAVCTTFCWDIRWALTPIFGPSFIKDCLHPTHHGYARFRIDPEVIRSCQRQGEGWNNDGFVPTSMTGLNGAQVTPGIAFRRHDPESGFAAPSRPQRQTSPKTLRPRKAKAQTVVDYSSDVDSFSEYEDDNVGHYTRYQDSPCVSPRTRVSNAASAWTSINLGPVRPGAETQIQQANHNQHFSPRFTTLENKKIPQSSSALSSASSKKDKNEHLSVMKTSSRHEHFIESSMRESSAFMSEDLRSHKKRMQPPMNKALQHQQESYEPRDESSFAMSPTPLSKGLSKKAISKHPNRDFHDGTIEGPPELSRSPVSNVSMPTNKRAINDGNAQFEQPTCQPKRSHAEAFNDTTGTSRSSSPYQGRLTPAERTKRSKSNGSGSTFFTAEDYRAALILLELSQVDVVFGQQLRLQQTQQGQADGLQRPQHNTAGVQHEDALSETTVDGSDEELLVDESDAA
ncbi:hypothetical protein AAFC00_004376 [Neodothiora populina]